MSVIIATVGYSYTQPQGMQLEGEEVTITRAVPAKHVPGTAPAGVWEVEAGDGARASIAAEYVGRLAGEDLVGYAGFAELAGLSVSTVQAYAARGRLPFPAQRVGRSPVWWPSQVAWWMLTRPGQGARTDLG